VAKSKSMLWNLLCHSSQCDMADILSGVQPSRINSWSEIFFFYWKTKTKQQQKINDIVYFCKVNNMELMPPSSVTDTSYCVCACACVCVCVCVSDEQTCLRRTWKFK